MEKVTNGTEVSGLTQEAKSLDETQRKSIPAQVFLNYFLAINYHIKHNAEAGLQQLPFFKHFKADVEEATLAAIKRQLLISWSTEFALRSTASLGNDDYLRYALHWTFPQAYYAIYASLQAFLYTRGINATNADFMSREVGRLVLAKAYPTGVGYYAAGHYNNFTLHRLPMGMYKPGLQIPEKEIEAQAQIGQFLRTTRNLKALAVRRQVQSSNLSAVRSTKTGKVLEKWNSNHWQQITWRLGYTTIFDLLGRLKISSSNKEIERFVEADIDFKRFHESLLAIVGYLNGIHESYIAKAIGLTEYQKLVSTLPDHLKEGFVANRLVQQIAPLFDNQADDQVNTAA